MKTSLIYAALGSVATFVAMLILMMLLSLIPGIAERVNYEGAGTLVGIFILFGVLPVSFSFGMKHQAAKEEAQRALPVHEEEHLRPLHLDHLKETLNAIHPRDQKKES